MLYFCHYDCLLSCLSDVFVYMIFHSAKWLQKNSRICKKIPTKNPRTKAVRGICDDIMHLFSALKAL